MQNFCSLLDNRISTQVEQLVSAGFTIGAALASWWYNNSFTQAAIKADEEYERQKKRV